MRRLEGERKGEGGGQKRRVYIHPKPQNFSSAAKGSSFPTCVRMRSSENCAGSMPARSLYRTKGTPSVTITVIITIIVIVIIIVSSSNNRN